MKNLLITLLIVLAAGIIDTSKVYSLDNDVGVHSELTIDLDQSVINYNDAIYLDVGSYSFILMQDFKDIEGFIYLNSYRYRPQSNWVHRNYKSNWYKNNTTPNFCKRLEIKQIYFGSSSGGIGYTKNLHS